MRRPLGGAGSLLREPVRPSGFTSREVLLTGGTPCSQQFCDRNGILLLVVTGVGELVDIAMHVNFHPRPAHRVYEAQIGADNRSSWTLCPGRPALWRGHELGVFHVFVDNLARYGMPEDLVGVLHAFPQIALEHTVLHHVTGNVMARRCDVVVRATLAKIDLEDFIRAVAVVALDIKIGEAGESDLLEEVLDQAPATPGLGCVMMAHGGAERRGRVLFEALRGRSR